MLKKKKTRCTAKIRHGALVEKTDEAAYWLGFLMADGSVSSSTNEIKLKLWPRDFDQIKKFGAYLGLPVERCKVYPKEALVTFSDKDVKNSLTCAGIGPQKTFTAEVKSPYLINNRFFWAGFIDGDGSLGKYEQNKGQTKFKISAISGSLKIMEQLKNFIFAKTNISITIATVQKKNTNHRFELTGKKAIRVMQLLYAENPYALSRKAEIARRAAIWYGAELDGELINWETATGQEHIWFEKNPRVKNRPFRVVGPNDLHIGGFSTLEIAISARDYFYGLIAQSIPFEEAKTKVLERFEEYFPKSYYAEESSVGYDKKRHLYICKLYYRTQIPGQKGKDVYILEHANKQLVQAVNAIAKNLRQVGYVYEGRRARIVQGGFLYENSIPEGWKNILIEKGVLAKKVSELEATIVAVWKQITS